MTEDMKLLSCVYHNSQLPGLNDTKKQGLTIRLTQDKTLLFTTVFGSKENSCGLKGVSAYDLRSFAETLQNMACQLEKLL